VIEEQKSERFEHVGRLQSFLDRDGFWHSFELPDGTEIRGANTLEGQRLRLEMLGVPADLSGKRALDIGTWDGWFAFELERRGADVVAIDVIDNPRFRDLHKRFNSRIDYRQMDVYDISPQTLGQFDVVLFMGVLYHLKHPLLGLERVCAVTRGMAGIDSFVLHRRFADGVVMDRPMMEFFERDEFGGQTDNWCAPNLPCLLAFCRVAGFARVKSQGASEYGAAVTCYREWEPVSKDAGPGPELVFAIHHEDFGINFNGAKDDSITCMIRSNEPGLTVSDLQPSVDRFGSIPLQLKRKHDEGLYEFGFRLPPGLAPGWHDVRVRARGSQPSNAKPIAVDIPLTDFDVRFEGIQDGATWRPNELDLSRGRVVSMWFSGLPANVDKNNLRVFAGEERASVLFIEEKTGKRQVNLQLSERVPPGVIKLRLELGEARLDVGELRVF
jgi:tRNA (mo5U34)-methyltransferase